ncbi:MAG: 50S ribosomal protein L9 [Endozoicomonadaceae bacterium]|nr:50S ribosomal protein L9 [Endozoicomonadaceae bacterium]MBE8233194.1 50S ribosomal protein L9 [Endozoicomonadaceae bacterium]
MEVILLENIIGLGQLGSTAKVKVGYARNFLLPFEKAIQATKANLVEFETRRKELERKANEKLALAQDRAKALSEIELTLTAKASEEGKLFGSIGVRDLADSISSAAKVKITKREIQMPDGPIRNIGEYDIPLQLHADLKSMIKVYVKAED